MMATIAFDLCSEFPTDRVSLRSAVSTPDGSAIVHARNVNETELRVWRIVWDAAPRQLVERLKDLSIAAYGSVLPMDFTPPGESAVEVRFREGTLRYEIQSATSCGIEIELEEVR